MVEYRLPYSDGVPDVDDVSLSLLDADAAQTADSTASASAGAGLELEETSGSDSADKTAIDEAAEAFVESEDNLTNLKSGEDHTILGGLKSGYPYEDWCQHVSQKIQSNNFRVYLNIVVVHI